jgi:hypothetical protein
MRLLSFLQLSSLLLDLDSILLNLKGKMTILNKKALDSTLLLLSSPAVELISTVMAQWLQLEISVDKYISTMSNNLRMEKDHL